MSYEDDELGSPRPMFATDRLGVVHDNRCERITHPNSAHPCNCARYVLQGVLDMQQTAAARNTRMDAMVSNDFETKACKAHHRELAFCGTCLSLSRGARVEILRKALEAILPHFAKLSNEHEWGSDRLVSAVLMADSRAALDA